MIDQLPVMPRFKDKVTGQTYNTLQDAAAAIGTVTVTDGSSDAGCDLNGLRDAARGYLYARTYVRAVY